MFKICFIILSFGLCLTYKFICPEISHWKYKATAKCVSLDKYVCLENVLTMSYQEGCSGIDYSRIGSKLVFQPFFNRQSCSNKRYQPFSFSTLRNTHCVLQKSLCKEEGQVVFMSNYTDKDTTCRCDYTKGYTFVTRPKHICYCVPTEEDCSCYRPICANINQDHKCRTNSTGNETSVCPEIIRINEEKNKSTEILKRLRIDRQVSISWDRHYAKMLISFSIAGLIICIVMQVTLEMKEKEISLHPERKQDVQEDNTLDERSRSHFFRIMFIGKKGVGKRSLIRQLLYQHEDDLDDRYNVKVPFYKLDISDKKITIEKEVASNVVLRKEPGKFCSDQEDNDRFDYSDTEICLYPEEKDTAINKTRTKGDVKRRLHNKTVKYGADSEVMSDTMSYMGTEESEAEYRICQIWEVERQIDFHVIHQLTSQRNVVFVLVIDGTDPPWVNIEESGHDFLSWLDTICCFSSQTNQNKEPDVQILIVFTKMDWLQERNIEEYYNYELTQVASEYMRKFISSVHFISSLRPTESCLASIRDKIFTQTVDKMKIISPPKSEILRKILERLLLDGVNIIDISDLIENTRLACNYVSNEEVTLCLNYFHTIGQVIYFDEPSLSDKIVVNPLWIIQAFRYITKNEVDITMSNSDCWLTFKETGLISTSLLHRLLGQQLEMKYLENLDYVVNVLKKLDIIIHINNSLELYIPCSMKSIPFQSIHDKFHSQRFHKTPWLCLEFDFLPPAIFNHILAWYIKHYMVWKIPSEKYRISYRYALYQNHGMFTLNQSKLLLVYGTEHVVALQILDSSDHCILQSYSFIRKRLLSFIKKLAERFQLGLDFRVSYKCPEGDIRRNILQHVDTSLGVYKCFEHNRNHKTKDIILSWCEEAIIKETICPTLGKLIDVATEAVQIVFDKEIQPQNLATVIEVNKNTIINLIVEGHIDRKSKQILFPVEQVLSSNRFDIKLMNCLLRNLRWYDIRTPNKDDGHHDIKLQFENSCSIRPFKTDNKGAKEKYLSVVNFYRICSSKFRIIDISDIQMQEYCLHLTEAIVGLGGERFRLRCEDIMSPLQSSNRYY